MTNDALLSGLFLLTYPISHYLSTIFRSEQPKLVCLLPNAYRGQNWNECPWWCSRSSRPTHYTRWGQQIWWVSFSSQGFLNLHVVCQLAFFSIFVQFVSFECRVFAGNSVLFLVQGFQLHWFLSFQGSLFLQLPRSPMDVVSASAPIYVKPENHAKFVSQEIKF